MPQGFSKSSSRSKKSKAYTDSSRERGQKKRSQLHADEAKPSRFAKILNGPDCKGLVRHGEKKSVDFVVTTQLFSTTLAIALMNGIQQGTGAFNRIGRKVAWENMYLSGVLQTISQGVSSVQSLARSLVIYDRQPTGTLPVAADIFQDIDQAGTAVNTATCGLNLNNKERFVILHSKRFLLPPTSSGIAPANSVYSVDPFGTDVDSHIEKMINLSGLTTEYKSSSNPMTISDIATGAIYLVAFANGNASAAAEWNQLLKARLNYRDA